MNDDQYQFNDANDEFGIEATPAIEQTSIIDDAVGSSPLGNDLGMGGQSSQAEMFVPPAGLPPCLKELGVPMSLPALNPPPFTVLQTPPEGADISLPDGIIPVGYKEDGTPVFSMMPFNRDEIEGAFVVQQFRPFPPRTEYVEIPSKGPERDAKIAEFYETIKMDSSAQDMVRNFEMDCLERIHQSNLDEMERMKYDDKIRDVQNEMHDREIAHIRHQTLDQYHAETKYDLTQVSPPNTVGYEGIPSQTGDPNLFRDDKGDLYRLNPDGTPYRVVE